MSRSLPSAVGGSGKVDANSTGGGAASSSKGFVFTSFSSDKADDGGDENVVPNQDNGSMPTTRPELGKSKSWSGTKRRGAANRAAASNKKRKNGGGLFSVLSSYQCVSSTSQSQET